MSTKKKPAKKKVEEKKTEATCAPSTHYELEDGVDMPPPNTGRGVAKKSLYNFEEMKVGQSFTLPADKVKACRSAMTWFNTKTGKGIKLSFRRVDDSVYRCWRTK
jgi:hypothetical protein